MTYYQLLKWQHSFRWWQSSRYKDPQRDAKLANLLRSSDLVEDARKHIKYWPKLISADGLSLVLVGHATLAGREARHIDRGITYLPTFTVSWLHDPDEPRIRTYEFTGQRIDSPDHLNTDLVEGCEPIGFAEYEEVLR